MKNSIKNLVIACLFVLVATSSYSLGRQSNLGIVNDGTNQNSGAIEGDGDELNDVMKNVESLLDKIDSDYLRDVDPEDIETGIYKGVLGALDDPYSVYYDEDEYNSLMEDTAGEFGGIGIQVTASSSGYIEVVSPIKGTPGERAEIQPGDYITHINGEAFYAEDLDKAVKVMRGEPGEEVSITILRGMGSEQEILDMTIEREIIVVESVHHQLLEGNIGYVLLTGFQENTDEEFVAAVEDLMKQGADRLILDLRNNPGGLLDVTMNIADYLMDEGTVISVSYKDESKNEELTTEDGKIDLPMVVLINKGSASASEVLSGALQDNDRAEIIGETSFGKGVIQQIYPIVVDDEVQGMKLTVAEFFTPNGNQIHEKGITPDKEVILSEDVTTIGVENLENDNQLQEAIDLIKQ